MRSTAIVDTGPLLAAIDRRDPSHAASSEVLRRRDLDLVIPALVVAEVSWFAAARLGPRGEAVFVRSLRDLNIEAPHPDDWPIIADLVERYGDFPLGTVDASIVVLADRLDTDLIVTLDRRHFGEPEHAPASHRYSPVVRLGYHQPPFASRQRGQTPT